MRPPMGWRSLTMRTMRVLSLSEVSNVKTRLNWFSHHQLIRSAWLVGKNRNGAL